MITLQPVILSGGSGTRLWPLSRELYPKQLLPLVDEQTMLQATVTRLNGLTHGQDGVQLNNPLIICNEEHRFLVAEQMRSTGMEPAAIILEPMGRNTAPAVTLAAIAAQQKSQDPVMLVLPADHVIQDTDDFHQALIQAAKHAEQGHLVTFGIVPNAPETGYGYIKTGAGLDAQGACAIERFIEKPDLATAEEYLDSGHYLWNSGMFVMKASVWLQSMEQLQPAMLQTCRAAYEQGAADQDFYRIYAESFTACPADSIDYAVMEPLTDPANASGPRTVVIPLQAGWSDVGAWPALWDIKSKDEAGNVLSGDTFVHNTRNSMVHAENRLTAVLGLQDSIVIETADAVLVAHKDHAQEVKNIVGWLKQQGRDERLVHRKVYRPWGHYEGIDQGERYQVKRITVNPGASLSLQMHHHRAEHWIVVSGTARVTRGEETFLVGENQSTYISIGEKHRLENPGTLPLKIIEVQSGSYLGEDDIVRFEDIYGRSE